MNADQLRQAIARRIDEQDRPIVDLVGDGLSRPTLYRYLAGSHDLTVDRLVLLCRRLGLELHVRPRARRAR